MRAHHDGIGLALAGDAGDGFRHGAERYLGYVGDICRVEHSPRRSHGIAATGFLHGDDFACGHMTADFRRIDRLLDVEQQDLVFGAAFRQLDDMARNAIGMLGTVHWKQYFHGLTFIF